METGGDIDNSGTLQGGTGGNGGAVTNGSDSNGNGGKGGHGISASGGAIINTGAIIGGDGGASGTDVNGGNGGDGGDGGDGIVGSNLKVVNSGSVRGSKGGAPGRGTAGKDGYAIRFQGGTNILELHAGSDISGIVWANSNGSNTFILGGDTDATFAGDMTSGVGVDGSAQYYGFQTNEKTGTSTWSLTGRSESWTIKQGVLQIGDGGTKGEITGDVNTGLDASTKGTLAFNRSDPMLFGGLISGTGNVRQLGGGTTVLIGNNTYSGGTILDGGTLSVSREANLGDASGGLSFNGGILQITGTTFKSTARTITWGSEGGGFDIADPNNVFTVSQNLGAGGALTKKGAGTLVLSGTNTYKGGTTVSDGILQLGDGTTDGSILGGVDLSGGDLVVANQDATVLDGNISGTGSVTQDGTGKLTLSGNNSYGDTYLNAGVISVEQEEKDTYGARISNRDGDSLTGRLGLAASYANAWKGEDGLMVNTSVYGIANLYQEFLGDARMNYAGTHMATDSDGTWGGIGAGGTYAWADNKYAIYGEGSINTSLNHFADSYAIKGNLGFKVKW
ncbi:autotransporter-associated beta strand repeat-containing protein [Brucella intermedia]|uniref:autotransporter-associated beta strand repeat-containing protein n=1 Tax=Brucella intermedia TaxID=94625 RepID=UPI001E6269BD|nr:autotransporter-associated beta strand repeat-containing protein [Brucella intermedia]MCB4920861.1 autotransporter-associated beta strand repeat-containing protein [Brucella intermedia]